MYTIFKFGGLSSSIDDEGYRRERRVSPLIGAMLAVAREAFRRPAAGPRVGASRNRGK